MKALVQRVKRASVVINKEIYSEIGYGMLVFLGVEKSDELENAQKLAEKLVKFRMFSDENDKMNKSIQDIKGEILVVSQFTLVGNCQKGNRPSFENSAEPEKANKLYEEFISFVKNFSLKVKSGKFAAMMNIDLINDGPVTFLIEK